MLDREMHSIICELRWIVFERIIYAWIRVVLFIIIISRYYTHENDV